MFLKSERRSTILTLGNKSLRLVRSTNTDNILYGWDNRHYSDIFVHRFHPHPQGETRDSIYSKMYDFIYEGDFPLSSKMSLLYSIINI